MVVRRLLGGIAGVALFSAVAGHAALPRAHPHDKPVDVIVRTSSPAAARAALLSVGGTVTHDLPLIGGFSARIPGDAVDGLRATPGVTGVSADTPMTAQASSGTDSSSQPWVAPRAVRADAVWATGDRGQGQTVALIDTGIADVPDLAGRVVPVTDDMTGRVTTCENLSGEPDCSDNYGHGTFVAGLIAGTGASSDGRYTGVAPASQLVSVKVAGRDGSADVSTVLAAIQWVVSFKDRYHITVLNLSLGTDSVQSWDVDPLNYAVERAWAAGIVVVVSGSNRGPAAATISKPGDDPWVITVGAVDDHGTVPVADDRLPDFSAHGPTHDGLAKPDVVAPGAHVVSLSSPGSAIDVAFPSTIDSTYRRGSGTSMSTGIVSGLAALTLSANPSWSPNRVKYAFTATARAAASSDPSAVGAGETDAYAATFAAPYGAANGGLGRSSGLGSLDASRGNVRVVFDDPAATIASGLLTAQLLLWDPLAYALPWSPLRWYTSPAYAYHWYGSNWQGSNWQGSNWQGSSWYGEPDTAPYGSNWQGSTWYGAWDSSA